MLKDKNSFSELRSHLVMTWPVKLAEKLPEPVLPDGYRIVQQLKRRAFTAIHKSVNWDLDRGQWKDLNGVLMKNGMFFVLNEKNEPVAVACAIHTKNSVELGWVAVKSEYQGIGIGKSLCAHVVQFLLKKGHKRIYLATEDDLLPAIHIYLKMGFVPVLHDTDMLNRWKRVCFELKQDFKDESWPSKLQV
ncbi:MAG: GNAT family N-acetyltransferase [Lentisphaeria bacterium]|nr:GNAT family N-acetyltransferase [Lentisphaeria bacterium]NQZ70318.1 GNAT family N-acetyltransferase [Lentisphaeria bacterium]